MNCESVRELLSAYFDQELSPDVEAAVREHLDNCSGCSQQLIQFAELSKLTADMRQPEVPAGMWASIDHSLKGQRPCSSANVFLTSRYAQVAVAAILLLAVTLAMVTYQVRQHVVDHHEMADVFGRYLDRFDEQPDEAQKVLLARYNGQLVTPLQVERVARFTPNAPDKLPQEYTRGAIYVLKMPCCTCTQSIYQDKHGRVLAIFEHAEQQRGWFGGRPMVTAQCHGKSTCLVQLENELAACWRSGSRHLTVVGARDVEQVSNLVAYLDAQHSAIRGQSHEPAQTRL